jgi:probable rRNA maturation factor
MLRIVGKTYAIPHKLLEKVAQATFSFLERADMEIELKFVSKAEITRLNSLYRHKDTPTDVLSFVIDDKPLLGQIFICYTLTREQAATMNKSVSDEVCLLLVHGILHVAGYDHVESAPGRVMEIIEEKILSKLGILR